MKKTTFLLIRHGEAEQNVKNIASSLPEKSERHLTDHGRKQIELLGEQLYSTHEPISIIFYSPLTRTRETAEILSEKTMVPICEDVRLRETDFGIFNERDTAVFHEKYPQKMDRLETDGSDGVESYARERKRLFEFYREVVAGYDGKTVAVVSHADAIQILYGILKNLSLGESLLLSRGFCPKVGEMIRV